MPWKQPHISKIYEALGAIGDKRIELSPKKNEAKVWSSSGNKFYTVTWNDDFTEMMADDNSAYWKSELSYPMIAILMLKGKISFDENLPPTLKGIIWKDINQKFKNDFDKTVAYVLDQLKDQAEKQDLINETGAIGDQLKALTIKPFGKKRRSSNKY